MAPEEFPCHIRRRRIDGTVTKSEVDEALRQFLADLGLNFKMNVDVIISLLKRLDLAFELEDTPWTYLFPVHLPVRKLEVMWQRSDRMKVYVGRRVQFQHDTTSIFRPGTFSLFQCKACVALDRKGELWRDGMIIRKRDNVYCPIECLVAMTTPLKAVDIVVRGPRGSESDCLSFLQSVMSLWMDVVEDYNPGNVSDCQRGCLSKSHLMEHSSQPAFCQDNEIDASRPSGPDAFVELQVQCTGKKVYETLRDLLVFPPSSESSKSSKILAAVQKHGSSRWYALGLAMGFSHDQVTAECHDKVAYADKLLALFSLEVTSMGQLAAEQRLLSACQCITDPIHQLVMGELGAQQQ